MTTEFVPLPPDPARVIEGLRDTGYSFTTAIADLVDNSIEAGATSIAIQVATGLINQPIVTIADNGCGMNESELQAAMQYGSPRNAVRRLSKFGLGLKTASTAFARRLLVTSRSSDLYVSSAAWDLDTIIDKGEWLLEKLPASAEDLTLLDEISLDRSGTVVRWEKIDRLLTERAANGSAKVVQNAVDRQVAALTEHLGLVFQRYLQEWNGRKSISLTINGLAVQPIDPFCDFEPKTKMLINAVKSTELPSGGISSFQVRGYVIPPNGGFTSSENQAKARISNENQGIYVYREDRLIHGPDWMRFFKQEPHYSLARIEFSFGQELDEAFNVDIKKSRIELSESIADYIREQVVPPIRTAANDVYRGARKAEVAIVAVGMHDESNNVIGNKSNEMPSATVAEIDPTAGTATLVNPNGTVIINIDSSESIEDPTLWIQTTSSIEDGLLWKPVVKEDHIAVALNTGHQFYERVYLPGKNSNVIQAFDYLLWALANAELYVISESHKKVFIDLRYQASRQLRILAEELPEVKLDNTESE